jgi:hypothetical protein
MTMENEGIIPMEITYSIPIDGEICMEIMKNLVKYLMYMRGQMPW